MYGMTSEFKVRLVVSNDKVDKGAYPRGVTQSSMKEKIAAMLLK